MNLDLWFVPKEILDTGEDPYAPDNGKGKRKMRLLVAFVVLGLIMTCLLTRLFQPGQAQAAANGTSTQTLPVSSTLLPSATATITAQTTHTHTPTASSTFTPQPTLTARVQTQIVQIDREVTKIVPGPVQHIKVEVTRIVNQIITQVVEITTTPAPTSTIFFRPPERPETVVVEVTREVEVTRIVEVTPTYAPTATETSTPTLEMSATPTPTETVVTQ